MAVSPAKGFNYLGENLCYLKELDVGFCKNNTNKSIEVITRNNKNLQILNLSDCLKITSTCLKSTGANLNHLKTIDLIGLKNIDNEDIQIIKTNNKNLTELELDSIYDENVTSEGL